MSLERLARTVVAGAARLWPQRPAGPSLEQLAESARYTAIANRLHALGGLCENDYMLIRRRLCDWRTHQAGAELVMIGDSGHPPMLIASGWAARMRVTSSGRRQIVEFVLPGECVGLTPDGGHVQETTLCALTTLETVDARPLLERAARANDDSVARALQAMEAQQREFLANQVMRLGALSRRERVAHLMLELHWRLNQAGLANASEFLLPIGRDSLSAALASRAGAIARVGADLRRRGYLIFQQGRVRLQRPDRLQELSGFAPPQRRHGRVLNLV